MHESVGSPDSIVLEFDSELAMLKVAIATHSLDDEAFDKVIDDVIDCLYQRESALENLERYTRVLETHRYNHILTRAAGNLGQEFYRRAEQFGLYFHGVLPWMYSGRCGTRQLILSKFSAHEWITDVGCELNPG
jgi:hypothetical protein